MELSKRKEGISLKYLVIKAQKGDAQAFIELVEQNKQSMYKVARDGTLAYNVSVDPEAKEATMRMDCTEASGITIPLTAA